MFKKLSLLALFSLSLYAESCWTSIELSKFAHAEFSEKAIFSIKDAVTCKPIAHAKFSLGNQMFQADEKGLVTLPLPPEELDRELPIKIEKKGYITAKESVLVAFGSYWNNTFLMSKSLPIKSARFVLSWGDEPKDLDLHLVTNSYHISFRKTKSIRDVAKLDRDAQKGYGPETITVDKLDKNNNYRVLVHRFSKNGQINNKTQVRVYKNNKIDKLVRLNTTSTRCVEVATIHQNKISYKTRYLKDKECR